MKTKAYSNCAGRNGKKMFSFRPDGSTLPAIMNKPVANLMVAAACSLILSGCITHKSTVVRDVERTPVEFENDAAARIFYEALSRMPASRYQSESTTKIDIPVIFENERHVVTGPNAAFNEAVAECDSNKDGKITELEAKIFAEHVAH